MYVHLRALVYNGENALLISCERKILAYTVGQKTDDVYQGKG